MSGWKNILEDRKEQRVEHDILRIVCMVLDRKRKQIHKDAQLQELGMTSLEFLSIVSAIEWWMGIRFAKEDVVPERFLCVNDFIAYVNEKKKEKTGKRI